MTKKPQLRVNSHRRLSFKVVTICFQLKSSSAALGALGGRRAWTNAFSVSDSQLAVAGTEIVFFLVSIHPEFKLVSSIDDVVALTVGEAKPDDDREEYSDNPFDQEQPLLSISFPKS